MEGRLDRLTDSINSLARSIAAGKQHKKTQLRLRLFIYIIVYQASIPRPSASGSGP
ncbi:MAG: hypothetical protein ACLRXQ_10490 [Phascolarctobacterium faecium]